MTCLMNDPKSQREQFHYVQNNPETAIDERNEIIEQYLPLIKKIAGRVIQNHYQHLDYEDLVTAGVLGLMQAIQNFNPDYDVSFAGYCKARIRGAMYDELRNLDWIPRHVRRQHNDILKAEQRLKAEFSRTPNTEELAGEIDLSVEELSRWQRKNDVVKIVSLNQLTQDDDGEGSYQDVVEDTRFSDQIIPSEQSEMLREFTRGLTRTEQVILVLYYQEDLTMHQIGKLLGISESRVCQIHSRVIRQIKSRMEEESYGRQMSA